MNPANGEEEQTSICAEKHNEESSPQPRLSEGMVNSSSSNPMAFVNMGGLGAVPATQLQAQQQMMLMAQMLQMNQQPVAVGSQGSSSASNNSQQGMAELVKLQQQAQMNFLQSMGGVNPVVDSMMAMHPSQQHMNQLLLSSIGGNMGQGFFPGNFGLNSAVPNVASVGSTPSDSNSTAANKRPEGEDEMNDPGWEDQYKALQRYRLVNRHTKVPARYKVSQMC